MQRFDIFSVSPFHIPTRWYEEWIHWTVHHSEDEMSGYLVWENDLRDWTVKISPQDPERSSASTYTSASLLEEYMEKHPDQCPDEIVPFHCHPLAMNIIHGTSRGDPSFDDWTIFLRYLYQYSIQRSLVFSVEGYYMMMMMDSPILRRKPVLKSAIEIEKLVQELSRVPEFLSLWDKKHKKKDPKGFHSLLRTRERCHKLSSLISSKLPGFVLRFFPW